VKKTSFRNDVQGLRAFAVVAVIFDHLIAWPSGGFGGVDVFFVISGFLITGILLRDHEKTGTISFVGFYRKRIRRIVPAATAVLIFTVAVGSFLFTKSRELQTVWDAVYSFFFMANWHFAAVGTDYFQATGPVSPLQHYWSLSVEEQFYLVWPWLILLVFFVATRFLRKPDRNRQIIGMIMGLIVIASFGYALWETSTNPTVAYFSTISRAWELGFGALLAIASPLFRSIPPVARTVLGWFGLIGIVASYFVINDTLPFPAPWAAFPVVATGLVIASGIAGPQRFLFPLTNRVSVFLGNISYSLYLWHFPIIIFALVLMPDQTVAVNLVILASILAISTTSYYFIEQPFHLSPLLNYYAGHKNRRRRDWQDWRTKFGPQFKWGGFAFVVALGVICFTIAFVPTVNVVQPYQAAPLPPAATATAEPVAISPSGQLAAEVTAAVHATSWPQLEPSIDQLADARVPEMDPKMGCLQPTSLDDESLCTDGDGVQKAVIIGDSVSVSWIPAFRGVLEPRGYSVRNVAYETCPFVSLQVHLKVGDLQSSQCNKSRDNIVDLVNALNPALVIVLDSQFSMKQLQDSSLTGSKLTAAWTSGRVDMINKIKADGRRVILMEPNPGGADMNVCDTPVSSPSDCDFKIEAEWHEHAEGDKAAATQAGVEYFVTQDWFAADENVPSFAGTTPQRWDNGHLTKQYATLLIPPLDALLFPAS
jgi:peptidoglycan/LPS O-acetylase OafA/YrhL